MSVPKASKSGLAPPRWKATGFPAPAYRKGVILDAETAEFGSLVLLWEEHTGMVHPGWVVLCSPFPVLGSLMDWGRQMSVRSLHPTYRG